MPRKPRIVKIENLVDGFRHFLRGEGTPAEELQNFSCASGGPSDCYLAASEFTCLEPVDISAVDELASYEFAIDEMGIV